MKKFKQVEETIYGGKHFVTYSEHIKKSTLMSHYHKSAKNIHVIPHGSINLASLVTIERGDDYEKAQASLLYCKKLLAGIFLKSSSEYVRKFSNTSVKFLFYASQFRPSKNVLTLLRAYNYLLRKRYIDHKLILTGTFNTLKEIPDYIKKHQLSHDVLLLTNLTSNELAACYKLADLTVNPSLSEGGCPFTLTESLSVGTPVIMAKISVTTEIIIDKDLQQLMLFDPYDWRNLATRIEWGLANRQTLLEQQLQLYTTLAQRNWQHVADEHIMILDKLSNMNDELNIHSLASYKETPCLELQNVRDSANI
ncbi:MAG: glycosyltransferase [Legionella sp.]|uniref:glycosyltransferase n=1 Tax=Legionella sp. TaxID=459 RepID=UPI0039E3AE45